MLSVCTIIKNESERLPTYLNSIANYADEIILVDNGSTDGSVEIAEAFGCNVIHNSDSQFDLGRNLYIESATEEWVLTLDADEMILGEDFAKLKLLLMSSEQQNKSGYFMPGYQYFGSGKWATFYLLRLFRNKKNHKYGKDIHGSVGSSIVSAGGVLGFMSIPMHHFDALYSDERNFSKRERNVHLLAGKMDANSQSFLSLEYTAINEVDKAIRTLENAIKLDQKKSSPAFLFLAQVMNICGRYDEALGYAKKQIDICNEKITEGDAKSTMYQCMIDSCNIAIADAYHMMGMDEQACRVILGQIETNPQLAHNYINLYLLSPETNFVYLDKAMQINRLLTDPRIYKKVTGPNIYRQQSSIIMGKEFDFSKA